MRWNAAEAFAAGRRDPDAPVYRNAVLGVAEAAAAAAEWRAAAGVHAESSWYGAYELYAMRAYWLGRLRTARGVWHAQGGRALVKVYEGRR